MKLYVLVRKDMSKSYQAVQGGHAVAEYLLRYPNTKWNNGTMVYLGVSNEQELKSWVNTLNNKNILCAEFIEPDIGNQLTAIACVSDDYIFNNLRLL